MHNQGSLRRRIVAAYVLLACVVCGCFGIAAYVTIQSIENVFIDKRLARAADQLIDRHWRGLPQDLPLNISLFQGAATPVRLKQLPPGVHEIAMDGQALHVFVRDDRGERFFLTDDESDFDSIELNVYVTLAAAFLVCLGLAVLLGRLTASRVIAPVTTLAQAVGQDDETRELPFVGSHDEVGVLARAFAARTEQLQRFLQRERLFVGDVSHELRTPLTIILGAAELLTARLRERPDLLAPAERIMRTAADTTERVGALLLLSRSPEMVDAPRIALAPLIRQEMDRCQSLLADKTLTLSMQASEDVHVHARPELASIAIGNLIRNACQFTEEGYVKVTLEPGRLVVEDTGTGIPSSLRERLFERFVRGSADPSTGSGLGLSIVRRVAEHLGWGIALEDRPGGGSRFILSL